MSDHERDNAPYQPRTGAADDTVSLLDLIAVIAKRKWLIVGVTGASAILILFLLLISMVLPVTSRLNFFPSKYKPTVILMLAAPGQSASVTSSLSQSALGALGGLLGGGAAGVTSGDLVAALLRTNGILDTVAQEFDFAGRYHLTGLVKTKARSMILGALSTKADLTSGLMTVGYQDTDKEFATRVVNRLVDLVAAEFTRLSVSKVQDKEKDLSNQLVNAQAEAARLQQTLMDFQNAHGVYDITQQASANVQAIAGLRTQIMNLQIQLAGNSKIYPATDYRVSGLKDQIAILQKQVDAITEGSPDSKTGIVPQKQLLSLSTQYNSLVRDITVQQAIVSTIQSQYQAAHADEMNRSQAIQVVEYADVPEVRSAPHRATTAVIVTVVMGFVSILLAFILEYFARAERDPVESGKLQVIRESFSVRRRSGSDRQR